MPGGWVPDAVLPERLRGSRWALSVRHVVVVTVVLAVGLVWVGCSALRARPEAVPERPAAGIVSGAPVAAGTASPSPAPESRAGVVVHVAGKVRRPGLIRAPTGARVADVLELAGGPLPGVDLTSLNLARQVTDGEQIVVGVGGGAHTQATPGGRGTAQPGGQVDLNSATLEQLEALPGVGPVLAQRIIDWRAEHGRFNSVDELQEVSGVGAKKFESIRPHVRV